MRNQEAVKSVIAKVLANQRKISGFAGQYDMAAEVEKAGQLVQDFIAGSTNYYGVLSQYNTIFQSLQNDANAIKDLGLRLADESTDRSVAIDDPVLKFPERLAIIMGTEGDGLSDRVLQQCDYVAKIPMHRGVDSLNVAAAASVAFYELLR